MKDFTKDELEILNTALSMHEKQLYGNESPTRFSSLLKMIGRMIEHYCDHKYKEYSERICIYSCTKCTHSTLNYQEISKNEV